MSKPLSIEVAAHAMGCPRIDLIAGARPNFMKIAPIVRALRADGRLRWRLVHTGQHYDHGMNDVFFEELGIPKPDVSLGAGGGSHADQTAKDATFALICEIGQAADVERQLCQFILRGIGLNEAAIASHLDREASPNVIGTSRMNRRIINALG